MRRFSLVGLPLALSILLLLSGLVSANAPLAGTPTVYAYLPLALKLFPTPTFTPTPPPPACPPFPGKVLAGQLTLDQNKPSYAVGENIFFHELITNPTGNKVCYGIVGVQVTNVSGGPSPDFHQSWTGDLWIDPGCDGPRDHCGGAWGDSLQISTPGTYSFSMALCYSDLNTCRTPGGVWQTFNTISPVVVIYWTPSAPGTREQRVAPARGCYLSVLDTVHMVCPPAEK